MKAVGWVTSFLVTYAGTVLLSGWVLTKLWFWFVVPTFKAPILSIPPAIGLALVVRYLTWIPSRTDNKNKSAGELLGEATAIGTIIPLFALGYGWIVHLFL